MDCLFVSSRSWDLSEHALKMLNLLSTVRFYCVKVDLRHVVGRLATY